MFTEKFYDVLNYEGAVSITSWGNTDPHVTCTWNSYLVTKEEDIILIPAAGMTSTEEDLAVNDQLILTLAARQVEGFNNYQGTGFRINGKGEFLTEGPYFDEMKEKYPFIRKVLQVTVSDLKQLL
ncbi:pyridoxamine 5'-phosphate oxidase-like protein [Aerococcus sp. 150760007-1]|uniref:Pyridoxamine 5'-phosphate oxidase family protein n=1 Tax=Aerococcus urinaeequi TaxID=51665 RepID=A0ABR5ZWA7_9LACT|nr:MULTISPECIES: pyridoxamine 5'-phosphate oxidase family protein [Lactobacillales]MBA5746017.1 pyridoxamine 5'-phosphate oxidase family protein [Aerococcus urinaeequi]MBA5828801.1 pyridoxamine 5'-phosphate oxidase family protein [Aerococcus urinaeequi]MBA5859705.1 pyridoxamine 5'-phosphate oxidase family protein [Aerococcus urinaeequi]OYQ66439.1 FMN-binding protein [Aerococcus sp. 1KP-2016]